MTKEEQLRNAFNKYRYASPLNDQTIKPVLEAMQEYASIVAKQECMSLIDFMYFNWSEIELMSEKEVYEFYLQSKQ